MTAVMSLAMGYLIGCISPAAFVSKKKNVDLKSNGTKNLGATNTALVLGKKAGYFVLFLDIFKSFFSYKIARLLFPQLRIAGLIAGIGVLLGHCFPFNMGFQGGKGLASFGGLVLAHDVRAFAVLLALGIGLAFLTNHGVFLAVSAAVLFPVSCWLLHGDLLEALLCAAAGGIILIMHRENLYKAIAGEDPVQVREGIRWINSRSK